MSVALYILGIILCGVSGYIDQNPTTVRFMGVIILQSLGVWLITVVSMGGFK